MDYWEECIREAFDVSGIIATDDQIQEVVSYVAGAHETCDQVQGREVVGSKFVPDDRAEQLMKIEQEEAINWQLSTVPCEQCTTTGRVQDGWGRDVICLRCDGEGRHR